MGVLILLVAGLGIFKFSGDKDIYMENKGGTVNPQIKAYDATYKINGQEVILKNGISSVGGATGADSKIVTKYYGNDAKGDFDGDGTEDSAFIVTQNRGGSSTFYYVTALLNKSSGKVAVDGTLLGDRIVPKSISVEKNNIVVDYVDRKPSENIDTPPSIDKTLELKVGTNLDPITKEPVTQFGEVVQNFEGEADPAIMTLSMKTWTWINTTYSDDKGVTPKAAGRFTLTLKSDKTFSATTDCNGIGGEYTVRGNQISFTKMMSTLMFCEGSEEADFSKMLSEVQNFLFTSKGELVLGLKFDSGSVFFR